MFSFSQPGVARYRADPGLGCVTPFGVMLSFGSSQIKEDWYKFRFLNDIERPSGDGADIRKSTTFSALLRVLRCVRPSLANLTV